MITASKEKPTVVMIVISLEDSSESETRYISGKTVAEVVAELFPEPKERKTRKPRTLKIPHLSEASTERSEPAPRASPEPSTEEPKKKTRRIMP
jgi:hypothetical protein